MLNVWANNASQWGDDTNQFEHIPFHQTSITRDFLSDSDQRFFISGLKGIGKTLLLQKKSLKIRNEQPGLVLLPATQPVEKLTPFVHSMSDHDAKDLSVQTGWFRVWLFVLSLSIVKRLVEAGQLSSEVLSEPVVLAFPLLTSTISYHMDRILRLGPHDRRLLIESESEPLLATLRSVRTGVVVFIDAIEDCVYSHMGPDLERYEDRSKTHLGILSAKVWRAAQVGFLRAAVTLHESNRHLKVFGALRREALEVDIIPDRQNLEPYLVNLEYSRDDLKGIFQTKLTALRAQSPEYFAIPDDDDVVHAFFGYTTLTHPSVTLPNLEPLQEPVLDYILRHSRGRPRELDLVGESLQRITERPRPAAAVRRSVREKSKSWFGWAKSEMIPYWREEYDSFLKALPSNIVPKKDMTRIVDETRLLNSCPDALRELFELGLLGCTVADDTGGFTQRFRQNDPELPVTWELFEASSHLVVHPAVNLATSALKARYEPYPNNVAGHGYGFVAVDRRFHVHFGLGALGTGLVIPIVAAAQGTSIAIVQRKSKRWASAKKWKGRCDVSLRVRIAGDGDVRPQRSIEARAFVGNPTPPDISELLDWWRSGKGHIVLLTNKQSAIKQIVEIATSVSTSVRDNGAAIQLAKMVAASGSGNVLAFYPFENDEKLVEAMIQALDVGNVPVVRVSADRICKDPTVVTGGVTVDAEDYYRVVIGGAELETRALFGGGHKDDRHSVVFEPDQRRFLWEARAKALLVNGLHFVYVVYAFRRLYQLYPDRMDIVRTLTEYPVTELLLSQEVQDAIDQIAALYVIYLLIEAEKSGLVGSVSDVDALFNHLMKLHDTFGERLAGTRDHIRRILSPRASVVAEKVQRYGRPLEKLTARLMQSKWATRFYEENGLDRSRVERDGDAFSAACVSLLSYISQAEDSGT